MKITEGALINDPSAHLMIADVWRCFNIELVKLWLMSHHESMLNREQKQKGIKLRLKTDLVTNCLSKSLHAVMVLIRL